MANVAATATLVGDITLTRWSRFYRPSGPGLESPYINGFGADQIQVDTGANAGAPQRGTGAFPAHVRGLQRAWAPGDEAEAELGGYATKGFTAVKMRVVGRDVLGILKVQAERFDLAYLACWSRHLGGCDLPDRARQETR